MPQSPLFTSSTTTQVTERMFSPSIETIAFGECLHDLLLLLGGEDFLDQLDVDERHRCSLSVHGPRGKRVSGLTQLVAIVENSLV
jgi:hypothetical protein